jgi:hypothetical protein
VPHFFNFQVCSASLLLSGFDAGPSLEFAVSGHWRTLLTNTSSRISATSLPSLSGLYNIVHFILLGELAIIPKLNLKIPNEVLP